MLLLLLLYNFPAGYGGATGDSSGDGHSDGGGGLEKKRDSKFLVGQGSLYDCNPNNALCLKEIRKVAINVQLIPTKKR